MKKAVISGDIIAYTSLSVEEKLLLEDNLSHLIKIIDEKFNAFTRIIKGDYIECAMLEPKYSLQIALLIKSFVKLHANKSTGSIKNNRKKYYKAFGVRMAIGFGDLERFDVTKGIIDGEAIYLSGRAIKDEETHNKTRIVIKNTLFFASADEKLNIELNAMIQLIDFIINKSTGKQSEVLFYKLLDYNEEDISKILTISQPVVNKHSTSLGWNVIENSINYYSQKICQLQ